MNQIDTFDFLHFNNDKTVKKSTKDEIIYYSDQIKKTNDKGKIQERNIVLTNKAIYNFKGNTCRRRIPLKSLIAITVSSICDEFIVHFADDEYDYLYSSTKKKTIIEIISNNFFNETGNEVELYILPSKLQDYITTKKDKKNNKDFSKKPNQGNSDVYEYIYGTKRETIPLVNRQTIFNENNTQYLNTNVDISSFEILTTIGRGAYGKILLAEYKKSNDLYAIKVIRKDQIISEDIVDNILLEKQILSCSKNEFILNLSFFFQTKERLYFVTPYMPGGDLYNLLMKKRYLDEKIVKILAAQIAIALEYLHSQGIIYRDLKPENILIGEDGYIKLCDFGASVHVFKNNKEYVFSGSPLYASPEMINYNGHSIVSDWWSFGILIYELLYGITPFYNKNKNRMFELINSGEIIFPESINVDDFTTKCVVSNEAKDLILKLLSKEDVRLGKRGLEEIMKHKFFDGVNFDFIRNKKLSSFLKPNLQNKKDLSNFEMEFREMDIKESPVEEWVNDYNDYFEEFNIV